MILSLFIHVILYVFIGFFAGLMAGILGVGGGLIVIPGLIFLFQLTQIIPQNITMHVAVGTSLAIMIFTSLASLRAHIKVGEILWPVFNKLWPGIVLGTLAGAVIAEFIPTRWLEIIFALFLLFVAIKMLTDLHVTHIEQFPGTWVNRLISGLVGLLAGLLGVGGGILIIPYLTYCGVAIRKIAAVSNCCTLIVGLVGSCVFMVTGWHEMASVAYSTGYVYWPAVLCVAIPSCIIAPLGVKLNYLLPMKQLKYGFILLLFLTAITLLF
jgi:uncharacterized membrane protein YfcA